MKKLKNKEWLERHAKSIFQKELKRRERFNARISFYYSGRRNELVDSRISKDRFETLVAPETFSIHANPEGTLTFFAKILLKVKNAIPIEFEMQQIKYLSLDAIMYFLAMVQKLKISKTHYGFRGTWPKDKTAKKLLIESGFLEYVDSKRITSLNHETQIVQISNGSNVDDVMARRVCDFTMVTLNISRQEIKKLYTIIVELMNNTKHHAYRINHASRVYPNWYIFCQHDQESHSIRYIFLDTGEGIPSTIRKYGFEKAKKVVGFESQADYIDSALKGTLQRSRTGEAHRGKGLPKIYSFYIERYINNLCIISNRGYYSQERVFDLKNELEGTVFYWELSRSA